MSRGLITHIARAAAVCLVAMLAIAAACPSYDKIAGDEGVYCNAGDYKCISPTLSDGGRCVTGAFTTSYLYVCVKPDGTLANYATPSLEDLSAYADRNSITCVSKVRCERQ
jgi:hypothetical protein